MARTTTALRLLLPAFLLGAIIAISFLEAPLKFLAPGVTIPIGLGIGRLVFTALNVLAGVVLIVLTVVNVRARAGQATLSILGSIWFVYLIEVAVIRPVLNQRSDLVIAGLAAAGTNWAHYAYIVADVTLVGLLIVLIVVTVRRSYRATSAELPRQGRTRTVRPSNDTRSPSRSWRPRRRSTSPLTVTYPSMMTSLASPPESRRPANLRNCPRRITSPPMEMSSIGPEVLIPEC